MLQHDLTGRKAELLNICYEAINLATESMIENAIPKGPLDIEETCDIPQAISTIRISNSSLGAGLTVNRKNCTNYDNF